MTAIHNTPQQSHGHAHGHKAPASHDPEHDIDAKSTTKWVLISTVVLFASLYFMLPFFDRVMQHERTKKIDELKAEDLDRLMPHERAFLAGTENVQGETKPAKKTIEDVMREMVPR